MIVLGTEKAQPGHAHKLAVDCRHAAPTGCACWRRRRWRLAHRQWLVDGQGQLFILW